MAMIFFNILKKKEKRKKNADKLKPLFVNTFAPMTSNQEKRIIFLLLISLSYTYNLQSFKVRLLQITTNSLNIFGVL